MPCKHFVLNIGCWIIFYSRFRETPVKHQRIMSLRWEFVFSRARAGLFAFCVLVSSLGEAGPLVRKIILQGDFSVPAEQVLEVLPFHEGDPFDPKQLDQGLDYLRHWGVFDVLEVRLDITSHGVDLYLQ